MEKGNQFNRTGLHNLKRKRRQKGRLAFQKQVHPLTDINPAISMLGLAASKASKQKRKKGI